MWETSVMHVILIQSSINKVHFLPDAIFNSIKCYTVIHRHVVQEIEDVRRVD